MRWWMNHVSGTSCRASIFHAKSQKSVGYMHRNMGVPVLYKLQIKLTCSLPTLTVTTALISNQREWTRSQLHLLSLIMPAPAASGGGGACCPVQQMMCSHTIVPVGQRAASWLSSVNGTGLCLIRLPVNNRFPQNDCRFCLKNRF